MNGRIRYFLECVAVLSASLVFVSFIWAICSWGIIKSYQMNLDDAVETIQEVVAQSRQISTNTQITANSAQYIANDMKNQLRQIQRQLYNTQVALGKILGEEPEQPDYK